MIHEPHEMIYSIEYVYESRERIVCSGNGGRRRETGEGPASRLSAVFPVGRASQSLIRKIFFSPFLGASQRCLIGYLSQCVGNTGNLVKALILIQQVWCGAQVSAFQRRPQVTLMLLAWQRSIVGDRPYTQLEGTGA